MVIATLLRGHYRKYPFILAFVVAEFLTVAAEIPAYWAVYQKVKHATTQRSWLYSLDEVVLQVLVYAVVISLIYQATARLKSRGVVAGGVVVSAVVFALVSFFIHYSIHPSDPDAIGAWLTPWTRDLNFCSAFLDLGLWFLLISSRDRDPRLLLISGGLGIRFTGEAIGDSIRQVAYRLRSTPISLTGSVVVTLVDLMCLFIWWQAFREKVPARVTSLVPAKKESGPPPTTAPEAEKL